MHSISFFAVLALAFSCTLALDITLDQQWKTWKDTNNKRYSDVEEYARRIIWESNLKKVVEHNLKADLGIHTYWLEMNKFADMTVAEFSKKTNRYNAARHVEDSQNYRTFTFNPKVKVPDTVDWRTKGYVTPVKTQADCEACWAFSAIGAIEGQNFNATGKLVSYSAQQLVDCSDSQGNMGCVGGLVHQVFDYIKAVGGLESEDSYPYEDDSNRCRFNVTKAAVKVSGYTNITAKDENALQQAVATIGPISVNIDSNHPGFQLYKGGVYHQLFCSEIHLDRSLLVVGYGNDTGKDYWLVKNSWGTTWGEQGYIRMTRNKKNECGIATAASYPLL
jgi:cathepsin L